MASLGPILPLMGGLRGLLEQGSLIIVPHRRRA